MSAALAFVCLACAALLDVWANLLLKRSDGFRRPWPGVAALALVLCAFGLLGLSLRAVTLSTAYAVWGGLGIVGAALLSRRLEGLRFTPAAWAGLALILGSVLVLHSGK
ncbi:DMT family transporter [Deinococcus sp.]|uniref:DMT family transporter n=1 Tax=Deinococcus sp. TaxID=47478 RepID=UPI003CC5BA0A